MPAKGACGATTIACNLAFQWKRLGAKRILLADLDPLTGTMSFLLKIKSSYSFLDALQRVARAGHDLWNAMVTKVQGIDVLLAPELMVEGAKDLQDPAPILDYARHNYDVVVIDPAASMGNGTEPGADGERTAAGDHQRIAGAAGGAAGAIVSRHQPDRAMEDPADRESISCATSG